MKPARLVKTNSIIATNILAFLIKIWNFKDSIFIQYRNYRDLLWRVLIWVSHWVPVYPKKQLHLYPTGIMPLYILRQRPFKHMFLFKSQVPTNKKRSVQSNEQKIKISYLMMYCKKCLSNRNCIHKWKRYLLLYNCRWRIHLDILY